MDINYGVQMNDEMKSKDQTNYFVQDPQIQQPQQNKNLGFCGFLSVAYYQPYFNVTQDEVFARLQLSILPIRQDFLQKISHNPDLQKRWGPFWICTTLILLLPSAGNFMSQIHNWLYGNGTTLEYDFEFVPVAAALLYCVGFGTPIVLTIIMKCFQSDIQLFQTICLYGYSLVPLIPITILCIIPNQLFQWILVLYGLGNSCFFLIKNLEDELNKLELQKKYITVGLIAAVQVALYATYKFYFFSFISNNL